MLWGVVAAHAVLVVGCSEQPALSDLFRPSDYQDPPGKDLTYVLRAPIVVLGMVTTVRAVGEPKPARERPSVFVQLTRITIQTEMILKGGLQEGSLSFYYFRSPAALGGAPGYSPAEGQRRLFFLEQSNGIYRSVGDVTDYTLAVRSGFHEPAFCTSESVGCCIAKLLMVPGRGCDSVDFALELYHGVHASNLLCSRAATLQLLHDLANGPDGTIALRARDLLRAETDGSGDIPPRRSAPEFLQVTNDCYRVPSNGGPVSREIHYKLSDDSILPRVYRNAVVWTHVSGDLPLCGADCPSSGDPGHFDDRQSVLNSGSQTTQGHTFQTFSAKLKPTGQHIPMFVRGFGQDYSVLDITKTGSVIYINGNAGGQVDLKTGLLIKGTYKECKN